MSFKPTDIVLIALVLIRAHAVGLEIEGLLGISVFLIELMFLMKFSNLAKAL